MSAIKLIVDTDYAKFDSGMAHIERKIKQVQQTKFAYGGLMSGTSAIDRAATARFDQEQAARDRKARQLWAERRRERERNKAESDAAQRIWQNDAYDPSSSPTIQGRSRHRAFGGASSAMFVSVARDSAASLASGANPITVLMQQGPQVAQALTMMGASISAAVVPIVVAFGSLATSIGLLKAVVDAKKAESDAASSEEAAASVERMTARTAREQLRKEAHRMNPGEAESYIEKLFSAPESEKSKIVYEVVERLAQVRKNDPTAAQKDANQKLIDMNKDMSIKSIKDEKEQRKEEAKVRFEERKKEIEKLQDQTGKYNPIEAHKAYRLNEQQLQTELEKIDKESSPKNTSHTSKGPLTAAQMSGHDIIGPTFSLIDIQKKHLNIAEKTLIEMTKLNQVRYMPGIGEYFGK